MPLNQPQTKINIKRILRKFHMKTIIKGSDDLIYRLQLEDRSGTETLITDFHSFTVEIFTDDITNSVNVSEYIDSENLLRVPAQSLTTLADGIVRMKVCVNE